MRGPVLPPGKEEEGWGRAVSGYIAELEGLGGSQQYRSQFWWLTQKSKRKDFSEQHNFYKSGMPFLWIRKCVYVSISIHSLKKKMWKPI